MSRNALLLFLILFTQSLWAQVAGDVVEFNQTHFFSVDEIKKIKAQLGIKTPTTSSITTYKLRYYTTGLSGSLVIVSAGVAVPNEEPPETRPVLSYQHGTLTNRELSPSTGNTEVLINGVIYSSNGYVVVAADYLGLGDDLSFHPYLHANSEASACADALLAVYNLKLSSSKHLFLTGYSQGGHATMALHRYWQQKYGRIRPITASAPMAGPYNLSGSVIETLQKQAKTSNSSVAYTGYLILAMNSVYHLTTDLGSYIRSPYLEKLPELYDGNHDLKAIAAALPKSLHDFLQESFVAEIRKNPENNSFIQALKKNNIYEWKSESPIQFCHGDADIDVPPANMTLAMAKMKELGSVVSMANIPNGLTHGTAATHCFRETAKFFESFRY